MHDEAETLERLRAEIAELRASRQRLVDAADADREKLERELHDGVQQHLVALAVKLQLARSGPDFDRATVLEELERDVQHALEETSRLAERMYAPLLETGGLAAALRSAAVSAGVPASVEVRGGSSYPAEVARTIYLCWLEALEHDSGERRASVTVREEGDALAFEIVGDSARCDAGFERLRDRVEALGGVLSIESQPSGTRVAGSLPLAR